MLIPKGGGLSTGCYGGVLYPVPAQTCMGTGIICASFFLWLFNGFVCHKQCFCSVGSVWAILILTRVEVFLPPSSMSYVQTIVYLSLWPKLAVLILFLSDKDKIYRIYFCPTLAVLNPGQIAWLADIFLTHPPFVLIRNVFDFLYQNLESVLCILIAICFFLLTASRVAAGSALDCPYSYFLEVEKNLTAVFIWPWIARKSVLPFLGFIVSIFSPLLNIKMFADLRRVLIF